MAASHEERLRIGEVAEQLGTTPRTIRYYEEYGLLEAGGERPAGGHRTYGPQEIERIRELIRLKDLLGVPLEELRELIGAEDARAALRTEYRSGEASEARQAEIITESIGHIDGQLELVRKRRRELERFEKDLLSRKRRGRELLRKLARAGTAAR